VTLGAEGCDLYLNGHFQHVSAVGPVRGVHSTGAGDVFAVVYAACRARGEPPLQAATRSSHLVAEALEARKGMLA
jgi:sugar/nucleoside kinase (ribokinase family)